MTFGEEGWGEKQSDREREVEREKRVKNRDREISELKTNSNPAPS